MSDAQVIVTNDNVLVNIGIDLTPVNTRLTNVEGVAATALATALAAPEVATPAPNNGNLAGNTVAPAINAFPGTGPTALTDTMFNGFGCASAFSIPAASATGIWWQPSFGRAVKPGEWIVASVLVKTDVANTYPTNTALRVILFDADGAPTVNVLIGDGLASTFTETLDATHRRFWCVFQVPARIDFKPIRYIWIVVQPHPTANVWATGFAAAAVVAKPSDINWLDWDAAQTLGQNARLTALESGSATGQATPDLLVPSSYHLLVGRPLRLLRDGLTSYREATVYDFSASGINGSRVGDAYGPVLALDGAELAGAGYINAKRRALDTLTFFRTPTTFYSTPASKTGSPKYHHIGDSLTQRGTTAALYAKMIAAGLTPTMQGTLVDAGGVFGEGRPNWKATDYTYATTATDPAPAGSLYGVHPLRPNGGTGLTITATANSSGVVTGATSSGGTGYPNGDWPVNFYSAVNANAGSIARGTVRVASGVPGAITITDGGTGYAAGTFTAIIVPSYAEYLANPDTSGAYGFRWRYNPYLRQATSAEVSASDSRIHNGYIFDFGFYVTTFLAGATPDQVVVMLGMNDLLKGNTAAQTFAAIQQIVVAVRAQSATTQIGIAVVGQAGTAVWTLFVGLWRLLSAQYGGQEASKVYLLPLFQVIDDKFAYDNEHGAIPSATDAQTKMQTISIPDGTHFDDFGRSQAAEMLLGWSMNRF